MLAPFSRKAIEFFSCPPERDKFFNLLEGSVRSGKTWAMMVKILTLNNYKVRGEKVIIGFSKNSIYTNVLHDLFTFVGAKHYRYNAQSGRMWLRGVEWLVIGVSNEGAERAIRGMTAGVIVWDEVVLAPKNVFDMAMSRLSPEGARFYGTTNPGTPHHFLITDYMEEKDFRHHVARTVFNLEDNLSLSEETRQRFRTMYQGVFYKRMILGQWVVAEGAIYRDALGDQCSFDDDSRPLGLYTAFGARYIGVDYGTTNPCVFLDVYDDGKVMWQDNEYYWDSKKQMRQKTDGEYADDLLNFIGPDKRGLTIVMDPSAASFRVECIKRGLPVKEAVNDVLDGIRRTSSALKTGHYRINRKKCPKTWSEAESYAWDEKKAAKGEEEPIKMRDHTCDAKRYVVHTMMPKWRVA